MGRLYEPTFNQGGEDKEVMIFFMEIKKSVLLIFYSAQQEILLKMNNNLQF